MEDTRLQFPSLKKRSLALLLDAGIFLLSFLLLYFLAFSSVFSIDKETELRAEAFLAAGLYEQNESGYVIYDSDEYSGYLNKVKSYYCGYAGEPSYFDTDFYLDHGGERKSLTPQEFNESILGVEDSPYFTLTEVDEEGFALLKDDLYYQGELKDAAEADLLTYCSGLFRDCFTDLFNDRFYAEAVDSATSKTLARQSLSFYLPLVAFHFLLPLCLPRGKTIGRLITNIIVVSKDGIYQSRLFNLLRPLPLGLIGLSLVFSTDFYLFLILLTVYLTADFVSFALTKDHRSLRDLASGSLQLDGARSQPYHDYDEIEKAQAAEEDALLQISEDYYQHGD